MKTKIVKNEARKTLTVIVSPISIGYVDYLFTRYNDERFFASGVLIGADYSKEIVPFAKELIKNLSEIGKDILPPGETFTLNDIISVKEDEFRLISKNTNADKEWDKQYKLNLTSKSKDEEKRFLFYDLEQQKPVSKEDGWKKIYAVEIEVSVGYNEDACEKYVFSVFHRAICIGEKESVFQKNDDAWGGFDFTTPDDDLPY